MLETIVDLLSAFPWWTWVLGVVLGIIAILFTSWASEQLLCRTNVGRAIRGVFRGVRSVIVAGALACVWAWTNWRKIWRWFCQTSMVVGMPITAALAFLGVQRLVFTVTCHAVGVRCEYAVGAAGSSARLQDGMDFFEELLQSNPGNDIVVKRDPQNKK